MSQSGSEVLYRHGDCTMRGYLVRPVGSADPGRAVLVFPDGLGLGKPARARAQMLADLGYVVFVADSYGEGRLARDIAEGHALSGALLVDVDELRGRAAAALSALVSQPGVDVDAIAAIGYCFGGTCALELARSGAHLSALVSFHGALATKRPATALSNRPEYLVCTGSADPLVPLDQVRDFAREMDDADCRWRMELYGGVKHNFTNPDTDALGRPGLAYDAIADRRSWQAMRELFAETIG